MAVSLIVAPFLLIFTDQEWIRLLSMAIVSTVAAIGVTFFTRSTDENVLVEFYKRVKPAGFWKKTAASAGDDPRVPIKNLIKEVKAIFLTAVSLFLMLIGVGKLLIPSPGQSILVPLAYIIVAILFIPLWWGKALEAEKIVAEDLEDDNEASAPS